MRKSFNIPFYATELPCPLPTNAKIKDAPDISLEYGKQRIVGVSQNFVVKLGLGVDLIEGENVIFVRENTNLSVPRIFALFSNPDSGKNYITMERIVGQTLLSAWSQLIPIREKEYIEHAAPGHGIK